MTATVRRIDLASRDGVRLRLAVLLACLAVVLVVPATAPAATKRTRKVALPAQVLNHAPVAVRAERVRFGWHAGREQLPHLFD